MPPHRSYLLNSINSFSNPCPFFFYIYALREELENIDRPGKIFEIWFSRKSVWPSLLKIIEYCFCAQNFVWDLKNGEKKSDSLLCMNFAPMLFLYYFFFKYNTK